MMAVKKRSGRKAKQQRRPRKPPPPPQAPAAVEMAAPIPVTLMPSTPRRSRTDLLVSGIARMVLFIVGLVPLGIWAFRTTILRDHTDPNPWLIGIGVIVSLIMANTAEDKISKSAKDIASGARGFIRLRAGSGTAEHQTAAKQGD